MRRDYVTVVVRGVVEVIVDDNNLAALFGRRSPCSASAGSVVRAVVPRQQGVVDE
jgi:hypothetical protein